MKAKKEIASFDRLRVVTSNDFITAKGLELLSLKARKLLYLVISQCELNDTEFYEYKMSVREFTMIMGLSSTSHIYEEMDTITDELMNITIVKRQDVGRRNAQKRHLMRCDIDEDEGIVCRLYDDMAVYLLQLKKDFSQPLLDDFMHMRSPYSMAVWHLMQKKMKSKRPRVGEPAIEFDLQLKALRQVTGTEDKLKQISEFKARVFDKAIREIAETNFIEIKYKNIKNAKKKITGFHCYAYSVFKLTEEDKKKALAKINRQIDGQMDIHDYGL